MKKSKDKILEIPILVAFYEALRDFTLRNGFCKPISQQAAGKCPFLDYRKPYGEIDLIVKKDTTINFVKVKTRLSLGFGLPEESITSKKQSHMVSSTEAYLQGNPNWEGDWRIDVIAIRKKTNNQPPEILHFENALS